MTYFDVVRFPTGDKTHLRVQGESIPICGRYPKSGEPYVCRLDELPRCTSCTQKLERSFGGQEWGT